MKKVFIVLAILVTVGVTATVIYLYVKKRKEKQDAEDRKVFNGKTRSEFLEIIRPLWRAKWFEASQDWILDNAVYLNAIIVADGLESCTAPNGYGNKRYTQSGLDSMTIAQRRETLLPCFGEGIANRNNAVWDKEKPTPFGIDWAKTYWLPQTVGEMDIDFNNKIVNEVLRKI